MKTCSTCNMELPLEQFYADRRYRDGYRGQCRRCIVEKSQRYAARPDRVEKRREQEAVRRKVNPRTAEQDWRFRLSAHYRMTPEGFDRLLESQGGKCGACGTTEPGGKGRFHVDHDHACCPGKKTCGNCVRGLLCGKCNVGIGMLGDSPERLIAAAAYLIERSPALLSALGSTV